MAEKILWFAYRHIDGTLHAKRYFGEEDLKEAQESPFVASVGFLAETKEEALLLLGMEDAKKIKAKKFMMQQGDSLLDLTEYGIGKEGEAYSWEELVDKLSQLKSDAKAGVKAFVPKATMLSMDVFSMMAGRLVSMIFSQFREEAVKTILAMVEKRMRHYWSQYEEVKEAGKHPTN